MEIKRFKPIINRNWHEIFDLIDEDIFTITEESYSETTDKKTNIFPIYENTFSFTNYCLPSDIKVCIIGQDSYHGVYTDSNGKTKPQAQGLAFSVPKECPIPPSLDNIYKNLIKYNHINKMPTHGCLEFWAYQGVLLLNTSLSVEQSKPNSHQKVWFEFTDELIRIISEKCTGIVFVLWGSNAYDKLKLIKNKESHRFVVSSHPSPLSAHNKFKNYESFMNTDHFGQINQYLVELNKNSSRNNSICWNIL
jgi:uracil-DNA glycosylase